MKKNIPPMTVAGTAFAVSISFLAVGVLGTLSRSAAAAPPQAAVLPAVPAVETVSFTKALETLSRRFNVAFVVEDAPASDTIAADALTAALQSGDKSTSDEAAQKVIEAVANAFEYYATRRGAVFLLQKRFTTFAPLSGDLPSVTLQECALALKDTYKAISLFNPRISTSNKADDLCGHLMTTLTQDQLSAMFNGTTNIGNTVNHKPPQGVAIDGTPLEGRQQKSSKGIVEIGLPVRSLTPSQRADVYKIACYYFAQAPLDRIEQEAPTLQAAVNPAAMFRMVEMQGKDRLAGRALGVVLPGKPGGVSEWFTLYTDYDPKFGKTLNPKAYDIGFYKHYTSVTRFPGLPFPANKPESDGYIAMLQTEEKKADADARGASEAAQKRRTKNPSQSLGEVAKWLNTRPNRVGNSVRVVVDPALAAKRVTLVGADKEDNLTVWSNIARVYDLATYELPDGAVLLTRPKQRPVRKLDDVPDAMQRVLPRPLRSFMGVDESGGQSRWKEREALRKIAAARFHTIATAALAASSSNEFKLSDLSEEGQQCLALMLMADQAITSLNRLAQPVPPFIANFDDRLLIGGLYIAPTGETQFSFGFAKEDNPGALIQGPGFGRVKYKH